MLNVRTRSPPDWIDETAANNRLLVSAQPCKKSPLKPVLWVFLRTVALHFLCWPIRFLHSCCVGSVHSCNWKKTGFLMPRVKASWISLPWYTASILSLISGILATVYLGYWASLSVLGFHFCFSWDILFLGMWILSCIKWNDLLLVSDDEFKIKRASGCGI